MAVLIVASTEPRAGRSTVAAGIAYGLARDGAPVTLARLAGDDSAGPDAAAFAELEYMPALTAPASIDELKSATGDLVVEAPAGSVAETMRALGAKAIGVGSATSPALDVPAEMLAGVVLTRVPASQLAVVRGRANVLAALPEDRVLAAPSVEDIARALDATWLHQTEETPPVDRVMLGTVASDAASPYFANRERICVITRYDKTDIQLAALLTDLSCMVITAGGEPSPYLIDRVRGRREEVALMETALSTPDAMETIEGLYGTSRFAGEGKLARIVAMLDEAGFVAPLPVAGAARA